MPLPTLQQFQAPSPQPATMRLQAMGMQDQMKRTDIAQQGLEETKNNNAAITLFKGYDFAFKNAKSEDEFKQIVKETTGRDTNIKFSGPQKENIEGLEVLGSDGRTYKMYGPKEVVFDSVNAIANDPSWLTDPQKRQQTMAYLKQNGVTAVPVEAAKDSTDKPLSNIGKLQYDLNNAKTEKEKKDIQVKINKEISPSEGGSYETNKAQQIDDTRSYYHEESRQLMDPESGLIRQGPKDNPNKYIDEYQKILSKMKKDMKRIKDGKLPVWYEGEKEGAKSDDDIAKILTDGGYKATPETIKKFRELNGL